MHIPVLVIKLMIKLFGWTGVLPIDRDQLDMLLEGNYSEESEYLWKELGIQPYTIEQSLQKAK